MAIYIICPSKPKEAKVDVLQRISSYSLDQNDPYTVTVDTLDANTKQYIYDVCNSGGNLLFGTCVYFPCFASPTQKTSDNIIGIFSLTNLSTNNWGSNSHTINEFITVKSSNNKADTITLEIVSYQLNGTAIRLSDSDEDISPTLFTQLLKTKTQS